MLLFKHCAIINGMDIKLIVKEKNKGHSYADIAKKFNVSRQYIQACVRPPSQLREEIFLLYDYKCALCGKVVGVSGDIHHKTYNYRILNNINNLQLLCRTCHSKENKWRKHMNTLLEQLQKKQKQMGLTDYKFSKYLGISKQLWYSFKEGEISKSRRVENAAWKIFGICIDNKQRTKWKKLLILRL